MTTIDVAKLRQHAERRASDALATLRAEALDKLDQYGLPSVRVEDWKYTDLATIGTDSNAAINAEHRPSPAAANDELVTALRQNDGVHWLVIRNGSVVDALAVKVPGVTIRSLSESGQRPELGVPLAALNAALLEDGLQILVEQSPDKPVALLFVDDADKAPGATASRIHIEVASGASVDVVEYHASAGTDSHYANLIMEFAIGKAANLRHLRIQDRARHHRQTARLDVTVAGDGRFTSAGFDLGGTLVRNDLVVELPEPLATAEFNGLYLVGDNQHVDNHTRVNHRVGPATSRQEFRGIAFGRGRAVWNGKAMVYEGADGTDAEQANHNLILSDHAEIDTKPELEIYAEDVRCAHGTTVGQLDDKALFYLRSRGLGEDEARRLLVRAFAAQTLDSVPFEALADELSRLLEQRLGEIADFEAKA